MSERHIIRDVESSLPVNVTLPAYRAQRAADAPVKPLDRFKAGLYGSARRYCTPSNIRSTHHA
jgi:hypothetical protein